MLRKPDDINMQEKPASPRRPRAAAIESKIYDAIWSAIASGRLLPGTPLRQAELAEIFGVSHERIRKVLHKLGHERKLTLEPNRGAFVPELSLAEIGAVYQARRVLETGIVAELAQKMTPEAKAAIRDHIAKQEAAEAQGDRPAAIRLAGDFHLLLARLLGNPEVEAILQSLITRTSVMVHIYQPVWRHGCEVGEHRALCEALCAGDTAEAIRLATQHLSAVESRLEVQTSVSRKIDLRAILGQDS
ncbi:GntR family transcriptional regulator [Telmatospirillum sp. J64-1]|uniref:GntR family transcriptional regulator n=1 Tax=Telmatospirillum sp. J64-1 TaxID=2502183 RepID=UPI00115DDABA|nr:GntR family transcriptional regulator [Telmatospirillum sp. J64-1]